MRRERTKRKKKMWKMIKTEGTERNKPTALGRSTRALVVSRNWLVKQFVCFRKLHERTSKPLPSNESTKCDKSCSVACTNVLDCMFFWGKGIAAERIAIDFLVGKKQRKCFSQHRRYQCVCSKFVKIQWFSWFDSNPDARRRVSFEANVTILKLLIWRCWVVPDWIPLAADIATVCFIASSSCFKFVPDKREVIYEYVGTVNVRAQAPYNKDDLSAPSPSGWKVRGTLKLQRNDADTLAAAVSPVTAFTGIVIINNKQRRIRFPWTNSPSYHCVERKFFFRFLFSNRPTDCVWGCRSVLGNDITIAWLNALV